MTETIYQMIIEFLHMNHTLDEASVRRIRAETAAGIEYIRRYGDPDAACEPGTESGALLCEYVLRAEAGALSTFATDFAAEIIQLKAITDAGAYAGAMGYGDDQAE